MNKNTCPKTLELLSIEPYDFCIRYFVAYNENTPEEIREYLKNTLTEGQWPVTPCVEHVLDNCYEDDD